MPVDKSAGLTDSGQSTGFAARQLLRQSSVATLATIDLATGTPYASLVMVATEPDATPVLLISGLARHTRNLLADARASLLVDGRSQGSDPLTALRVTLIGRAKPVASAHGQARYLQRHPSARDFAAFADFGFWSLEVAAAHTIAGFGRILEVPGEAVRISHPMVAELACREEDLVESAGQQRVATIDLEGIDLLSGERRLFPEPPAHLTSAKSLIEGALRD